MGLLAGVVYNFLPCDQRLAGEQRRLFARQQLDVSVV